MQVCRWRSALFFVVRLASHAVTKLVPARGTTCERLGGRDMRATQLVTAFAVEAGHGYRPLRCRRPPSCTAQPKLADNKCHKRAAALAWGETGDIGMHLASRL